jgi:hypothetical protein
MKNTIYTIENRTRDLPICTGVPPLFITVRKFYSAFLIFCRYNAVAIFRAAEQ